MLYTGPYSGLRARSAHARRRSLRRRDEMGMNPGEPVTPMPAEKFPAASGRRALWLSAAIVAGVPALWGIFFLMPFSDSTRTVAGIAWLAAASLSAAGVLLFVLYSYRKTLVRLRRGIRTAQDGALEPIADIHPGSPFLDRLLNDYNRMISTLGSMFSEVEECQNRVLAERNRMNAIIQSLPGALLGIDDELCVNAINKLTEEYFGLSQEELRGRNLFDLLSVGEVDREILRDAFLCKRRISNREIDLS
ncbi:MAG TPA: PAS domain-containing sensor histidine kinase, partial [Chromatiales bacterium]|nr:PAS domain-containing sensor histidine kinase [Chromatiales bacterium]